MERDTSTARTSSRSTLVSAAAAPVSSIAAPRIAKLARKAAAKDIAMPQSSTPEGDCSSDFGAGEADGEGRLMWRTLMHMAVVRQQGAFGGAWSNGAQIP